jgi:hypothetical protein
MRPTSRPTAHLTSYPSPCPTSTPTFHPTIPPLFIQPPTHLHNRLRIEPTQLHCHCHLPLFTLQCLHLKLLQ